MAYSKIDIFNMALNHLSITAPIATNSMNKDSRAIILNNFYETARDEVLKAFDWGFANTYKELTYQRKNLRLQNSLMFMIARMIVLPQEL